MMLLIVCSGILLLSGYVASQDLCDTERPTVPNLPSRLPSERTIHDNDNYITEQYYTATSHFDMATTIQAKVIACGYEEQCWMDDNIPTVEDGERDIKMCRASLYKTNNCFQSFTIKVRNCGDYRLYFLEGKRCRYCFTQQGTSSEPAPAFVPGNVNIIPQLIRNASNLEVRQYSLKFLCDFSEESGLFYIIYFYINGIFLHDQVKSVPGAKDAFLLETELPSEAKTIGITISCEVRAKSTSDGNAGNPAKSPEFYAGLKVEGERHISLPRGEKADILVRPTVPIGCTTSLDGNGNCEVVTQLVNGKNENSYLKCNQADVRNHNKCSLKLQGGTSEEYTTEQKWNTTYTFSISAVEDEEISYQLDDKTYLFQLRSAYDHHDFWNGVSEPVRVTLYDKPETTVWKEKKCSIVGDPHMTTFDSQPYELQKPGVYRAFQHSSLPIQVQVKSSYCKGTNWPRAFCICGVAVIVGKSFHILDICERTKKRINYICGKHDEIQVIPKGNDFEFRVPTGLKVKATRWFGRFWDIYLYPTVMEVNNTSGLCGSLDNNPCNDFTHKDGTMPIDACKTPLSSHPNAFIDSFKLDDDEHLFQSDEQKIDKLVEETFPDYPESQMLCFCPYNDEEGKTDLLGNNEIVQESVCGYRKYTSCTKHPTESPCQKRHLHLRRRRRSTFNKHRVEKDENSQSEETIQKRRSTSDDHTIEIYRYILSEHLIQKRSINEADARKLCNATMSENPLTSKCKEMNVDNSDAEIENCVLDLMATGDTAWADPARDRASQVCLTEVKKNGTIQEVFPEAAAHVKNMTCPNNCSKHGTCENGECSCDEGFDNPDCSLDLSVLPDVTSLNLGPDPICDVRDECFEVFVNGGDFPSNWTYACHYTMLHVDNNGSRWYAGSSEIRGYHRNIYQVTCPLTYSEHREDVFVSEYELYLQMDDKPFSLGLPFIILDSTCQGFEEIEGKYSYFLESGYCFINGTCYDEGVTKTNDTCQRCVSLSDPYAWTTIRDTEECVTVVESDYESTISTSSKVPLIIVIVVLSVICVAAITTTLVVWFKRTHHTLNSRISSSQLTLTRPPISNPNTGWK